MTASSVWSLRTLPLKPLVPVPSDIEVARAQTPKSINELAKEVGLKEEEVLKRHLSLCYLYRTSLNHMVVTKLRYL